MVRESSICVHFKSFFFKTNLRLSLSKLIDLSFKYLVTIIQSSQTPLTEEGKEKNILPGPHPSTKFDK